MLLSAILLILVQCSAHVVFYTAKNLTDAPKSKADVVQVALSLEDLYMPHLLRTIHELKATRNVTLFLKLSSSQVKELNALRASKLEDRVKAMRKQFKKATGKSANRVFCPAKKLSAKVMRTLNGKFDEIWDSASCERVGGDAFAESAPRKPALRSDQVGVTFNALNFVNSFMRLNGLTTAPRTFLAPGGLPAEDIAALPRATLVHDDCAVCLGDLRRFAVDERENAIVADLARLPTCGHVFHRSCLVPWLSSNRTCPKCRANVN